MKFRDELRFFAFFCSGFGLFLFAFIVSLIVNPSLSRSGGASEGRLTPVRIIEKLLIDLGATSNSGITELLKGLAVFAAFAVITRLVLFISDISGLGKIAASTVFLLLITALPAAVLLSGLVALDFFVDDQSLRDVGTATYITPYRSLIVCLKLSTIILIATYVAYLIIDTFQRGTK